MEIGTRLSSEDRWLILTTLDGSRQNFEAVWTGGARRLWRLRAAADIPLESPVQLCLADAIVLGEVVHCSAEYGEFDIWIDAQQFLRTAAAQEINWDRREETWPARKPAVARRFAGSRVQETLESAAEGITG